MRTAHQKEVALELFIVWALVIFLIRGLYELGRSRILASYIQAFQVTSIVQVLIPILVLNSKKESFDFFEKSWSAFFKSIQWFLLVCLLIFPALLIGNHFYQKYIHFHLFLFGQHFFKRDLHYVPAASALPLLYAFLNNLSIAFGEEFFFRGYVLGRFRRIFQDQKMWMGVYVGRAFFLTALLFALSHSLIVLQWWHPFIFFPALAFGWLREKTQALTAAILFHACCNVFSFWVGLHYW